MPIKRSTMLVTGLLLAAAFIAAALSLLTANWQFLGAAYREEQHTVHRLAGALLDAHPELELDFAAAMDDADDRAAAAGEAILAKYGYGAGRNAMADGRYRALYRRSVFQHGLFSGAALLMPAAAGWFIYAWSSRQNRELTEAVEQFLAGETKALSLASHRMHAASYGRLSHMLGRLGDQATQSLARLDTEKTGTQELVTDIAHQLKTPIAALTTCLDLAAEADTPDEQWEFIDRSRREVARLRDLGEALISISRLEAAMIVLKPEPTPISTLLAGAVSGVYGKAAAKSIEIVTEPYEDTILHIDPRWTTEALTNLLDNAVKYSPPETQITLTVRPMTHFVRLEVTDRGPGIPRAEAAEVFGRFFRGSDPVVRENEGSGVGLYLSREIAERQGGTLSHRPAPGGGTTFLLQLRLSV